MSAKSSTSYFRVFIASLGLLIFSSTGTAKLTTLKQSCINEDCSAARVIIDNPPVNLFDINVITDFDTYLKSLQDQNKTKVVVVSSDVPGYFAGHLDLNLLSNISRPGINASYYTDKYVSNIGLLLDLPVVFIGEINGRTWGAGNENAVRYDIRFAGPDAIFGAPEAAGGLLHWGGAQQLVQLIGPGLTTEYLLASTEVNAAEAARVGWVNSVYSTTTALQKHVEVVANRIAKLHIEVIKAHKESIREQSPTRAAIRRDLERFNTLTSQAYTENNLARILISSHNQSLEFETDFNDNEVKALEG